METVGPSQQVTERELRVRQHAVRSQRRRANMAGEGARVRCECADPACREPLPLEREERTALPARWRGGRFYCVLRGHEAPDVERVVAEADRYLIVECTDLAREPGGRDG